MVFFFSPIMAKLWELPGWPEKHIVSSPLYKYWSNIYLSSPRGARAFDELRRYHTRPLWLNWGPESVHFGKTHQCYYVLRFPLRYLKTAQKTVQSLKNLEIDQNGKLVSVKKNENFTFVSENGPKWLNDWGFGQSKKKTLPETLPTTAMSINFSK